ncbi:phosphatidate cytidylyltransferase [Marinicrinis sediminis]|uniref:Phosphatidate cytidylyltransferase n=1 Tax=Marinicrinis sediminis TaxID=1652465 RepID=A0ABW5R4T0_9BACL
MKQRVITGILAAILFLGLLTVGGIGFTLLILLLALIGFFEFVRLNQIAPFSASAIFGYISVAYIVIPWQLYDWSHFSNFQIVWITMFIFLTITVVSKNRVHIEHAAMLTLGVFYVGIGFHYMLLTRLAPEQWGDSGLYWSLLIFVCIWLTDIGAYFSGMAFGKRLLWPSISPKKTIEGALGGLTLSIAAALLFAWYSPDRLELVEALWIGLAAGVVGQLGDFIQSAYKRVRGAKDSGILLPGHGGVLDRCDSWIIVFPFVHMVQLLPFT